MTLIFCDCIIIINWVDMGGSGKDDKVKDNAPKDAQVSENK